MLGLCLMWPCQGHGTRQEGTAPNCLAMGRAFTHLSLTQTTPFWGLLVQLPSLTEPWPC